MERRPESRRAAADVAGEVFSCEFERREDRVLADLIRDELVDGNPAVDIFGDGPLRLLDGLSRHFRGLRDLSADLLDLLTAGQAHLGNLLTNSQEIDCLLRLIA